MEKKLEHPTSIKSTMAPRHTKLLIKSKNNEFITESTQQSIRGNGFMAKFPMFGDRTEYSRTEKGIFTVNED